MKNRIVSKLSTLVTCAVLGGGPLVQAGCDTSSSNPVDGDNQRSITLEEITLEDIEALGEGEVLRLDLDVEGVYLIFPEALTAAGDRIILSSANEGDLTAHEWLDQALALGVQLAPYQIISIAGDPEWFGTLSDEQLLALENEPLVETTTDRTIEFYWKIGKKSGCVVIVLPDPPKRD